MTEKGSLRAKNLTDWFIHEARGSLVTINRLENLNWGEDDYEVGRQKLKGVLGSFDEFEDAGQLTQAAIRQFIEVSTEEKWNAMRVEEIWESFNSLIGDPENE